MTVKPRPSFSSDFFPGLSSRLRNEIANVAAEAREFSRAKIRPLSEAAERRLQADPRDLDPVWPRVFAEGRWLSRWMPKVFGGGGAHPLTFLAALDEFAYECLGFANLLGAHYVGYAMLAGTLNLRAMRAVVSEIASMEARGEAALLTAALTEPTAGSDLEDLELMPRADRGLRARADGDGFILKGAKHFISNAPWARWHVVSAALDSGLSLVALVPAGRTGVSVGPCERKLGQHVCPASPIFFDDVRISKEDLLVSLRDFSSAEEFVEFSKRVNLDVLSLSRPGIAILGAGAAERVIDETLACLSPEDLENEWVQVALADLRSRVLASRLRGWTTNAQILSRGFLGTLSTPWMEALGPAVGGIVATEASTRLLRDRRSREPLEKSADLSAWSSWAKAGGGDVAERAARTAYEILGSRALNAPILEKILRDGKLMSIYEGSEGLNLLNVYQSWLRDRTPGVRMYEEPPHA